MGYEQFNRIEIGKDYNALIGFDSVIAGDNKYYFSGKEFVFVTSKDSNKILNKSYFNSGKSFEQYIKILKNINRGSLLSKSSILNKDGTENEECLSVIIRMVQVNLPENTSLYMLTKKLEFAPTRNADRINLIESFLVELDGSNSFVKLLVGYDG